MSHSGFSVRLARPGDLDKLASVERSAASRFREVGLDWLAEGDTTAPALLDALCRTGTLWVAVDDHDGPVGFLAGHELDGQFHIAEVSVAEAFQRKGIGARLIQKAVEHGRNAGYGAVTLTTYRDLAWNGPFYLRLGFVEIGADEAGPEHSRRLKAEAEAGHDPARRCVMAIRFDQPARKRRMAESRSNI